jgi:hypothetical protein
MPPEQALQKAAVGPAVYAEKNVTSSKILKLALVPCARGSKSIVWAGVPNVLNG